MLCSQCVAWASHLHSPQLQRGPNKYLDPIVLQSFLFLNDNKQIFFCQLSCYFTYRFTFLCSTTYLLPCLVTNNQPNKEILITLIAPPNSIGVSLTFHLCFILIPLTHYLQCAPHFHFICITVLNHPMSIYNPSLNFETWIMTFHLHVRDIPIEFCANIQCHHTPKKRHIISYVMNTTL